MANEAGGTHFRGSDNSQRWYTMTPDFTAVEHATFSYPSGDTAASIRKQLDDAGNSDGQVTQAEVDQFISSTKNNFSASRTIGLAPKLDGKVPTTYILQNFTMEGATGAISSGAKIHVYATAHMAFEPAPGEGHVFEVVFRKGQDLFLSAHIDGLIMAPGGAVITSVSGFPGGGHLGADHSLVSYLDNQTYDGTAIIHFEIAGPATSGVESPMPSAIIGLSTVLLLAGYLRSATTK